MVKEKKVKKQSRLFIYRGSAARTGIRKNYPGFADYSFINANTAKKYYRWIRPKSENTLTLTLMESRG